MTDERCDLSDLPGMCGICRDPSSYCPACHDVDDCDPCHHDLGRCADDDDTSDA